MVSSLESRSGPWRGRWSQALLRLRGEMKMTLTIFGTSIRGGGTDASGAFTMDGSHDPETDEVAITKSYPQLTVLYKGRWDGTMICGHSAILGARFYDEGEFELWPAGEEGAIGIEQVEEVTLALPERA